MNACTCLCSLEGNERAELLEARIASLSHQLRLMCALARQVSQFMHPEEQIALREAEYVLAESGS